MDIPSDIRSTEYLLMYFYLDGCSNCEQNELDFALLQKILHPKINILKINASDHAAIALQYHVQGVPMLVLLNYGKIIWRFAGKTTNATVVENLQQWML